MAKSKLSQATFIITAKSIHGEKYDYSDTVYLSTQKLITIKCYKHGSFNQRAAHHLRGHGCIKCGREVTDKARVLTTEIFVERSKAIHGDAYDYGLVKYRTNRTKVSIICKIHGVFMQAPDKHLGRCGCPKCGTEKTKAYALKNCVGFTDTAWELKGLESKHFDSFKVYLVKVTGEGEVFYKIGRTYNTVNRRFRSTRVRYSFELLKVIDHLEGVEACRLERRLQALNKENKHTPITPFNGMHECFKNLDKIIFKYI